MISKTAQDFVRENLLPKDIYCYHVKLLDVSTSYCLIQCSLCDSVRQKINSSIKNNLKYL